MHVHQRRRHRHFDDFEHEPYECDICHKKFGYKASVKKHKYIFHADNVTVYDCNKCDFNTKYQLSLKNHMMFIHKCAIDE